MSTFALHSIPPEPDDDPPPKTEAERLADERAALLPQVRRGVRTERQVRILRRIAEITNQLLAQGQ